MKFTKANIEKLELPGSGQRVIIWDPDFPGFGLRVTPSGKMYIVQSRVKGISRRVSLGKHGVITLQQARKKAQGELAKMNEGIDPIVEKKTVEAYSKTLQEIIEEYIRARRDLKPSYIADIEKHLSGSFEDWAIRPAVEITRDKVAERFRELTERSAAQANQAFRILRAVLNYARAAYRPNDKPIIVENPVSILSDMKVWNKVKARSGRIPTDKIGAAWNAIQELRANPFNTIVARTLADVTAFLLLTGARWNEAAGLTWDRVNLEEGWWYLPDPKNRNPVKFPLSEITKEIIEGRPQINEYIFPARSGKGRVKDPRGPMDKISAVAGVRVTAHDMRRTFRAIAGECGLELWKAKLLMNHRLNQDVTIGHYTETNDLRYLAPEINKIAEWVAHQGGIAASDKVVPFPGRAGGE